MDLDPQIAAALKNVSTGTITTVLLKKGLRNVWMRGPKPLRARPAAADRARLHHALRAGARGPGDAGILGLATVHARGDRGHARRASSP